jgi:hypothetical protein
MKNSKQSLVPVATILAVFVACVTTARSQDPTKTLPRAYKLQFENEWVKVTRVHYEPHEKLPPHQHTLTGSAYVYLNESGPVIFRHIGLSYGAVTRPPTKAGTVRLFRAVEEIHEVESLSDQPSDFLRVEFKTEPLEEKKLFGKFHREPYPTGENFEKVQFENEQIRITRLAVASGKAIDVSATASEPALIVSLAKAELKAGAATKSQMQTLQVGQTLWFAAGEARAFSNSGEAPVELLRFDFKTKPVSKDVLQKKNTHGNR